MAQHGFLDDVTTEILKIEGRCCRGNSQHLFNGPDDQLTEFALLVNLIFQKDLIFSP